MTVAAVLVAAGAGTRLGAGRPKAFVELAGIPLYVLAARALCESAVVDSLVVVVPAGLQDETRSALADDRAVLATELVATVVVGGASRQASVAAGLAALSEDVEIVLVHDAARALAPATLIRSVVAAVRSGHPAVVPGLAVTDTVKQVGGADEWGAQVVESTLDRSVLRLIQTPQGFTREVLEHAHRVGADLAASEQTAAGDDAGLVEATGAKVYVVPGDALALKITGPHDLVIASAFLTIKSLTSDS